MATLKSLLTVFRLTVYVPLVILLLLVMHFVGPISQQQEYHNFADKRFLFGINNFCNVTSNALYIIAGVAGLLAVFFRKLKLTEALIAPNVLFFASTMLIGFGSAYYHLAPEDSTLFWDRLPMSVAFMAFFVVVLERYTSISASKYLLLPLCLLGVLSVLYWHLPFSEGTGDLRIYYFVQFAPMILVPIFLLRSEKYELNSAIWGILIMYVIAKLAEYYDDEIFGYLGTLSGHTIKHIISAAGIFWYIYVIYRKVGHENPQ